jgi:hypothetical protein
VSLVSGKSQFMSQGAQKPIVKAARVLAGPGDPTPDGCFGVIEDASRGTWTETFGDGVHLRPERSGPELF